MIASGDVVRHDVSLSGQGRSLLRMVHKFILTKDVILHRAVAVNRNKLWKEFRKCQLLHPSTNFESDPKGFSWFNACIN
jgi:hypothetical protein